MNYKFIFIILILFSIHSVIAVDIIEFKIDSSGNIKPAGDSVTNPSALIYSVLASDSSQELSAGQIAAINKGISKINSDRSSPIVGLPDNPTAKDIRAFKFGMQFHFRGETVKYRKPFAEDTKKNLEQISEFAKASGQDITIRITDPFECVTTNCFTFMKRDGKVLVRIPGEYKFQNKEGVMKFSVTTSYNAKDLILNGVSVVNRNPSEITFQQVDGIDIIKVDKGVVDLKSDREEIKGISDVEIRLNDKKNVVYADFVSSNGGTYIFDNYRFDVGKDGRVIFNPLNSRVEINGAGSLSFNDGQGDGITINSVDRFILDLDSNGDPRSILIGEGGSFIHGGDYKYFARNGELNVFFRKQNVDIDELEGPLVIFDGDISIIKGKVKMLALGNDVDYEGLTSNSLVNFDRSNVDFDIVDGDARLINSAHEVLIENGRVKLKTINADSKYARKFSFSYTDFNDNRIDADLDSQNGLYFFMEPGGFEKKSYPLPTIVGSEVTDNDLRNSDLLAYADSELSEKISFVENRILKKRDDLKTLVDVNGDPKEILKLKGEIVIQEYIAEALKNQQLGVQEVPIRLSSYTQYKYSVSTDDGFGTFPAEGSERIDFEIKDGKIVGYFVGDSDVRRDLSDISNSLEFETKSFLRELKNSGASYSALQNIIRDHSKRPLKYQGYSETSQEFKDGVKKSNDIIESLSRIRRDLPRDSAIYDQIGLEIAKSHLASKRADSAIPLLRSISGDREVLLDVRSDASRQLAVALFQQDPLKNSLEVHKMFSDTLRGNPDNGEVQASFDAFRKHHLSKISSLAFGEIKTTQSEADALYGSGHGFWQNVRDGLHIAFAPATNLDLATRSVDTFIEKQEANFDLAISRHTAASDLAKLIDSGVDLRDHITSHPNDQFMSLYSAKGYERIISSENLEKYISQAGGDFRQLEAIVIREEGPKIGQEFALAATRTTDSLLSIQEAIRNDRTVHTLIATGSSVEYKGDQPASETFVASRLEGAKPIKYDTGENIVLAGADIVFNPISYLGVTVAAKAGTLGVFGKEFVKDVALDIGTATIGEFNSVASGIIDVTRLTRGSIRGTDEYVNVRQSRLANLDEVTIQNLELIDIDPEIDVSLLGVGSRIREREGFLHYINRHGESIPIPNEGSTPFFRKNVFLEDLSKYPEDVRPVLEKLADNVNFIGTEDLILSSQDATRSLERLIGDEPYTTVFLKDGKSHQWAYDLSLDGIDRDPHDIVFVGESGQDLIYNFDEGIRNYVIFDDITYSGTQLSTYEFGEEIPGTLSKVISDRGLPVRENMVNYYAVVSQGTDSALKKFTKLDEKYLTRGVSNHLIRGRKIPNIGQILSSEEIDILRRSGFDINSDQTLTFHSSKIPDSLSLPSIISDNIVTPNGARGRGLLTPYKSSEEFQRRWKDERIRRSLRRRR